MVNVGRYSIEDLGSRWFQTFVFSPWGRFPFWDVEMGWFNHQLIIVNRDIHKPPIVWWSLWFHVSFWLVQFPVLPRFCLMQKDSQKDWNPPKKKETQTEEETKHHLPGDSKRPFHPLVGGHDSPLKRVTWTHHPKKVTNWITREMAKFEKSEFLWFFQEIQLPWEPKTFIFRGYNSYIGGLKPSCFMVSGPKGRWWFQLFFTFTPTWGRWTQFDEHIFSNGLVQPPTIANFSFHWTPSLTLGFSQVLIIGVASFASFVPFRQRIWTGWVWRLQDTRSLCFNLVVGNYTIILYIYIVFYI